MRKDASNISEHAKHTRNAGKYSKRAVNKRVRKNLKHQLKREAR